jgi:hypothetical protein
MRKGADGVLLALVLWPVGDQGAAFPTGFRYDADAGTQLFRCFADLPPYFIGYAMWRTERQRRNLAWAIVWMVRRSSRSPTAQQRGGRATGSYGQSSDLGVPRHVRRVLAALLPP